MIDIISFCMTCDVYLLVFLCCHVQSSGQSLLWNRRSWTKLLSASASTPLIGKPWWSEWFLLALFYSLPSPLCAPTLEYLTYIAHLFGQCSRVPQFASWWHSLALCFRKAVIAIFQLENPRGNECWLSSCTFEELAFQFSCHTQIAQHCIFLCKVMGRTHTTLAQTIELFYQKFA